MIVAMVAIATVRMITTMICKNCATGADVLTRARELEVQPNARKKFVLVAKYLHNSCGGCDCAHNLRAAIERLEKTSG